jgi:hypothetical protein
MSTPSDKEDHVAPAVSLSFVDRAIAHSRKKREESSQTFSVQAASSANYLLSPEPRRETIGAGVSMGNLAREAAVSIVEKVHAGSPTPFHLVAYKDWETRFESTNRGSPAYRPYFILCHVNTKLSAGWAVCPFYASGQCKIQAAVRKFDPKSGGTTSWSRHSESHKASSQRRIGGAQVAILKLGAPAKRALAISATKAIYLDFRPFTYISGRGIRFLLETVFREGQRLPDGELPDFGDYIPSASTVAYTLKQQAVEARLDDVANVLPAAMKMGGGMCCDGLKKKRTGVKFYDLSLTFFVVTPQHVFGKQDKVTLCNRTLFVTEHAPGNGESALAIRQTIDRALSDQFSGLSLDTLNEKFTFVTDWAATMPRIVGASVSEKIFPLSLKWAGCVVHQLDTCLGAAFNSSLSHDVSDNLIGAISDIKNMKKVIEGVKRADLNHQLPRGCAVFQEVETRFHSVYDVTVRFTSSLPHILKLIDDGVAPESVSSAMAEILTVATPRSQDPSDVSAPRLLALVTVLKPVVEAMVTLQASQSPTLHLVLPLLTHILSKLLLLQHQSQALGVGLEDGYSTCVRELAAHLSTVLLEKIVLHPIHATASILHPNLRDLSSFGNLGQRRMMELRERALALLETAMRETSAAREQAAKCEGATAIDSLSTGVDVAISSGLTGCFSLANCFDPSATTEEGSSPWNPREEIDKYLRYKISQQDKELLQSDDPFACVYFWIRQRGRFPIVCEAALRILAVPASQCLSERAFSAAGNAQPATRDSMLPSTLSDIIYLRSRADSEADELHHPK